MSSELVRQALAFVDPEENETKKRKRLQANQRSNSAQGQHNPYKRQNKKSRKSQEDIVEVNIKKFLAFSNTVCTPDVAQKIVERAVKGKPLLEKFEKTVEKEQSILFPEEEFENFEKKYFCK